MKPTPAQLRALARRDPVLGRVMRKLPPFPDFPVKPRLPYFHTLARIIIFQQLATGAARTIHGRVQALGLKPRPVTPAAEHLVQTHAEVRGAGLSRS
ncbi:MAG: DNA-3-methyladenine glycosylase 2 family protein, partial [Gemmatimonadota bacterium]